MILRRPIFSPHPRTDFWALVEGVGQLKPSSDDEVNGVYAFFAYVAVLRGTRLGAILEWAWIAFDGALCALVASLPLPVRIRLSWNDSPARWRVRWLGWTFLWGREFDQPAVSPIVQGVPLAEAQLEELAK